MNARHVEEIAAELSLGPSQVSAAARLLEEGSTVPFIARYRKEATESLDEVALVSIRDRLVQLAELDRRREAIVASLAERDLLSDELRTALEAARTMTQLEDLYLPYRPKRRTRATMAREKGLAPLAERLLAAAQGREILADPFEAARAFVDGEKGVADVDEALAGARDIIAETVSEDGRARHALRLLFVRRAEVRSSVAKGKEEEGAKYRDYFDWSEKARQAPSHRLLALFRGEKEGFLSLSFQPEADEGVKVLERLFVTASGAAAEEVRRAVVDGYGRLAAPSMETELRGALKKKADVEAVAVFARNVREVLMASPLGQKRLLAVDPGIRTGCKVVALDGQGRLLATDVVYAVGRKDRSEAERKVRALVERFSIEAVAVGNGTGGREAEAFLKDLDLGASIPVVLVNESGASIYSASDVAREEFPDQDLTVRGAVSIGRRLQDPLAELVKIDPKSIGVGQYQHDVDQKLLKSSLDDVVLSCVNAVGVEVNTASRQLLTHVSGLGESLAAKIVAHREAQGPFRSRSELRAVPRLGPKAFEQCAGFLRVRGGDDPLDGSAVHPERYPLVRKMARDLGCSVEDLLKDPERRRAIDVTRYVSDDVGLPTLKDILAELEKPGRDPREAFESCAFDPDVKEIDDLRSGMILSGVVTNVTAFGAFVDVGVHQDGLVHVSRLADHFVADPASVVRPGQRVTVSVVDVDRARKRISLSMKGLGERGGEKASPRS
ncbi:RNA-binding transcriptional accessory protein [Aminithiophilus ramosus]|uniref:RNA-binding transcriptional accessory protein n=1 Tax=Aminithiophilus ramosus TaxID=3029084 RepID=A0A9Q7EYQ8_9BACT|nr:Tex family protein [Aminithiophilus ramosus]QTX32291.1 RNA-binding transcriptional accessory protein [Aminithiophilus ramosus]